MSSEQHILIAVPERFVGDCVIVRPFTDAAAAALFAAIQESRTHIQPWLPWADQHQSVDDTLAFIRRTQARWILRDGFGMGIFARQEGTFPGGIGLDVVSWDVRAFDIGYWVRKSAEGHGYVSLAIAKAAGLVPYALSFHYGHRLCRPGLPPVWQDCTRRRPQARLYGSRREVHKKLAALC